jgi:hypothetical protein
VDDRPASGPIGTFLSSVVGVASGAAGAAVGVAGAATDAVTGGANGERDG